MIVDVIVIFAENTCLDKSDKKSKSSCDQWVGSKYCTEGSYVGYMKGNCSRSCCENGNFLLVIV